MIIGDWIVYEKLQLNVIFVENENAYRKKIYAVSQINVFEGLLAFQRTVFCERMTWYMTEFDSE